MPYLILLLVCKICEIKQKLWMVLIEFAICMFSFYIVATSGKNKMNYISVSLDTSGKYAKLVKEYGALHSFYTISMVLFMTITFAVIIRSYLTKREVSFRTAIMLASICLIDVFTYVVERALGDVFDALVSKRCYKEKMSYDTVFSIIEESLGKQFDEKLGKLFLKQRDKLIQYYNSVEE